MSTEAIQFTDNVIHYITREACELAIEYKYGAGGASLGEEFSGMDEGTEFTLVEDSNYRMIVTRLQKFYLENKHLLQYLAEMTDRGNAVELDSLVFVSLFLSGDGLESAYLRADDDRDLAELYSKVLADVLMQHFPHDLSISVEPNGVAYIEY